MENSKDLRCKLKIAERSEEIISEIEKSRCPVCGGKLKYESNTSKIGYVCPILRIAKEIIIYRLIK